MIQQKTSEKCFQNNKYEIRLDTYNAVGVIFKELPLAEYLALQAYQNETGIQVIFPITDTKLRTKAVSEMSNANIWYKTGNTEFEFANLEVNLNGNLFLPSSSLNELRRIALEGLKDLMLKCLYYEYENIR